MLVGHLNAVVVERVTEALTHTGTLFVTPSPQATQMGERFQSRFGLDVAAFVVEPVIENLSIVVTDEGYLAGVRVPCDEYGVVLVFDEVKTGPTAGTPAPRP